MTDKEVQAINTEEVLASHERVSNVVNASSIKSKKIYV